MKVFVTGGSGYIGSAVVNRLVASGHAVTALARSERSAERLRHAGSDVLVGDMRDPQAWLGQLGSLDRIVHLAATFGDDMAEAETLLIDALLDHAGRHLEQLGRRLKLVYTGGCWLYGPVGDRTAIEGSPFDPLPDFAFMVEQRARLLEAPQIEVCVVHPAIVWDESGGAIERFLEPAKQGRAPTVVGSFQTRWPLVHKDDLAELYRLAAEAGADGADYHGVAEPGVHVGDIASAIAKKFGAPMPIEKPVADAMAEFGDWAAGLAFDQTMDAPVARDSLGWIPTRPGLLDSI